MLSQQIIAANINKDNTAKGYMIVKIVMKDKTAGQNICHEITSTKPLEVVVDKFDVLRVVKKAGKTTTTVFGTPLFNVLHWLIIE